MGATVTMTAMPPPAPTTAAITPSKLMGAEVKRKEDPRFITGSSTYVTDVVLPVNDRKTCVKSEVSCTT